MVQGGFLFYLHITFGNPMWRKDMNTGKSDVEERYEYRHQNTQKLVKIDASGGVI